jgi:hypothetical protein
MAAAPKLENASRVLIVEGYGDLLFYAEFLEHLGVDNVFIKHFVGRSDLQTKLETFLSPALVSAKSAIGVIVDADQNPAGIAGSMAATLGQLTNQQIAAQTWTQGGPRVGLFVVPSNNATGEIETLVWQSWSSANQNLPARQCIESFRNCMAQSGLTPQSPDKALIGALLSITHDEDPRLGPGARAGVFDFERPELQPLKAFLQGFA